MPDLYSPIEPYAHGMLDADDGQRIYWEACGNPEGKAALVVHGGPGSGCTPWQRRLFDPTAYRIVLFDQRNCGRSEPHASDPATDLTANTTQRLIADMELLRDRLGVERWLLLGGSWGSTLSLAYAVRHLDRVTEMILFGVTTGRRSEFDWTFRGGLAAFFPEQWDRLRASIPGLAPGGDIIAALDGLLNDPDPVICQRAAAAWSWWESATPDWPPSAQLATRFHDERFALAFARIVIHYVRHNAWLGDDGVLAEVGALAGIPGVLVNGRFDFQAPLANAWELRRAWPRAELVVVDDAGHSAGAPGVTSELIRATNRFAGVEEP